MFDQNYGEYHKYLWYRIDVLENVFSEKTSGIYFLKGNSIYLVWQKLSTLSYKSDQIWYALTF
jgi:bifunctional pyridoxal-dependent enzyme with beta-cystathionase and maltose regulon repressor activities